MAFVHVRRVLAAAQASNHSDERNQTGRRPTPAAASSESKLPSHRRSALASGGGASGLAGGIGSVSSKSELCQSISPLRDSSAGDHLTYCVAHHTQSVLINSRVARQPAREKSVERRRKQQVVSLQTRASNNRQGGEKLQSIKPLSVRRRSTTSIVAAQSRENIPTTRVALTSQASSHQKGNHILNAASQQISPQARLSQVNSSASTNATICHKRLTNQTTTASTTNSRVRQGALFARRQLRISGSTSQVASVNKPPQVTQANTASSRTQRQAIATKPLVSTARQQYRPRVPLEGNSDSSLVQAVGGRKLALFSCSNSSLSLAVVKRPRSSIASVFFNQTVALPPNPLRQTKAKTSISSSIESGGCESPSSSSSSSSTLSSTSSSSLSCLSSNRVENYLQIAPEKDQADLLESPLSLVEVGPPPPSTSARARRVTAPSRVATQRIHTINDTRVATATVVGVPRTLQQTRAADARSPQATAATGKRANRIRVQNTTNCGEQQQSKYISSVATIDNRQRISARLNSEPSQLQPTSPPLEPPARGAEICHNNEILFSSANDISLLLPPSSSSAPSPQETSVSRVALSELTRRENYCFPNPSSNNEANNDCGQTGSMVLIETNQIVRQPQVTELPTNQNQCLVDNISLCKSVARPVGPVDCIRTESIHDFYDLETRPFARGKFAQVKRCTSKDTKQCYAAKCIKKRRRLVDIRHEILLEIEALKLSYHTDHIVKVFEVYETPTEMILILEMAKGGELQRVLDGEEYIEEKIVQRMIRQIIEGLIHLHDNEIAHLDIKPQNLLLTEPFPNGDIKLCDFGISRRISKDCEIREICGTPDYVAPEILRYDPISLATDMWSLGILTYVLLSGYSPFGSDNKQQTFCNITQAPLDFPSEIFDKVSSEAIDFISKLIVREPLGRLTSRQARDHRWLAK